MFFEKLYSIGKIMLLFEIKRFKYYPLDNVLKVVTKIIYVVINLLFWYVVGELRFTMEGWTYRDMIVFLAFSELFYGLDAAVFSNVSRFWTYIHAGSLDNTLTRPLDSRIRFIILNVDYLDILLTFVEFLALLFVVNEHRNILMILVSVLVVIGANFLLSMIRLCASYLAFWHGKMNVVSEISDCLTSFNKYPLTILPKGLRYLFKFIFPFYFFSTFSTELICFSIDKQEFVISVLGFVSLFILWISVNNILWNKGLKRYESING